MRIFRSTNGDPMLVDSSGGLNALHDDFEEFISSGLESHLYPAITAGSPAPYDELLSGLRVVKSQGESLRHSDDGWLELSGPEDYLRKFQALLIELEDGSHRHFHSLPVSLIIEADSYFLSEGR